VDEELLSNNVQNPRFNPMPPTLSPVAKDDVTPGDEPRKKDEASQKEEEDCDV
jgi:hypothetical protein